MSPRKRLKQSSWHEEEDERSDLLDRLPDDIVISILCRLSAASACPADFISALITCKKLNKLGLNPLVLAGANPSIFAIRAKNWSEYAHRFFHKCVIAGNVEACFTLGMIRFYCFQNRGNGASLMAKAAAKSHAPALYSLAVIQFNGSGGTKNDKDLRAGVALCSRATALGYIDAIRELGHCLQDGYGTRKNAASGRRLIIQANARELALIIRALPEYRNDLPLGAQASEIIRKICPAPSGPGTTRSILDICVNLPPREVHPVNRFLTEWFESKEYGPDRALKLCSHAGCGRPETRRNEYRRCSACSTVNYCSRNCQSQDWKLRHRMDCVPMEPQIGGDGGDNGQDRGEEEEEEGEEDGEEDANAAAAASDDDDIDGDRMAEIEEGEMVVAPLALLDG